MLRKHWLKHPWERSRSNWRILFCAPWLTMFLTIPTSLFCALASSKCFLSFSWPGPLSLMFFFYSIATDIQCSLGNYQAPCFHFLYGAYKAEILGQAAYMPIVYKPRKTAHNHMKHGTHPECMSLVKEELSRKLCTLLSCYFQVFFPRGLWCHSLEKSVTSLTVTSN